MYSRRLMLIVLALAVFVSGCLNRTPQTPQPTAVSPEQIETQVAQQVAEQLTQVALSQPSPTPLPPTDTPLPTEAPLPTDTPLPTVDAGNQQPSPSPTPVPPLPTNTPALPTATLKPLPTATPVPLACKVISQNPSNGKTLKPGKDFDVTWTVQNVGSASWDPDEADYRYTSGDKFYKYEVYDLPKRVRPGEKVDLVVDMRTPDKEGTYKTTWELIQGDVICTFSVEINVKK